MIIGIQRAFFMAVIAATLISCTSGGGGGSSSVATASAGFVALQQGGFVDSDQNVSSGSGQGIAPATALTQARYNQYIHCVTSNNSSFMSHGNIPFSALRSNPLNAHPLQAASELLFTSNQPSSGSLSALSLQWRALMQSVLLTCCAHQPDTTMTMGPSSYEPNFMSALGLGFAMNDYVTYIQGNYPYPKGLILGLLRSRSEANDPDLPAAWYSALVDAIDAHSGQAFTLNQLSSFTTAFSRGNRLNRLIRLFRVVNLEDSCGDHPTYMVNFERIRDSRIRAQVEAVRSRVYCQKPSGLVTNLVNAALLPNAEGQSACSVISQSQQSVRALTVEEHRRFSSCTQLRVRDYLSSHGSDPNLGEFMGEYDTCCARVSGQVRRSLRMLSLPNTSIQFMTYIPSLVINNGSGARSTQANCRESEDGLSCLSRKMQAVAMMLGACSSYSTSNTNCIRPNMNNEQALLSLVLTRPTHEDAQLVIDTLSDSCVVPTGDIQDSQVN